MKIRILKEIYKKKDCKKKSGESGECEVTSSRGKSCYDSCEEAAGAIEGSKNEEQLEEMNVAGAIQGAAGNAFDDRKEELEELLSTSAQVGGIKLRIKFSNKEHDGHVERSRYQGLRNVMESE